MAFATSLSSFISSPHSFVKCGCERIPPSPPGEPGWYYWFLQGRIIKVKRKGLVAITFVNSGQMLINNTRDAKNERRGCSLDPKIRACVKPWQTQARTRGDASSASSAGDTALSCHHHCDTSLQRLCCGHSRTSHKVTFRSLRCLLNTPIIWLLVRYK